MSEVSGHVRDRPRRAATPKTSKKAVAKKKAEEPHVGWQPPHWVHWLRLVALVALEAGFRSIIPEWLRKWFDGPGGG